MQMFTSISLASFPSYRDQFAMLGHLLKQEKWMVQNAETVHKQVCIVLLRLFNTEPLFAT